MVRNRFLQEGLGGSPKSSIALQNLFNFPYLLLTLTVLFWAGNAVLGRAVHDQIPAVGLAFWRWFCAFLIVLPTTWRYLRRDWQQILRHWKMMWLLSALGVACFNTLFYKGLHFTTAINAVLMQSSMPLMVVLLSYLFFRETLTIWQAIGILISSIGAIMVIIHGDWHLLVTLSLNRGDLIVLLGVAGYATYTALLRLRPVMHPFSFLTVTFALGSTLLLPLYIAETLSGHPVPLNSVTILSVGYVAVFPSILSYLFYNRGVELIGANRAGLFIHLVPVFGSMMAVLLLGEHLHWFHGVGFALILSGIFLVTRRRKSPPSSPQYRLHLPKETPSITQIGRDSE
ncbi:MAG: DMT family transporter [Scytolyngbya sp. HA4215-MV1]|jgi:drug/metabolite transporter (DMT)-like permease|nr:DMT family transporter [Scytolyngbya sp. HA4215-MV1]